VALGLVSSTAGEVTLQLQGLSGAARHRIVWTTGSCADGFDPQQRVASYEVHNDGEIHAFRLDRPVDVSGITLDTWDSGSAWVVKGRRGTTTLGCAPTRLYDMIDISARVAEPGAASVFPIAAAKGKGLALVEQRPDDVLRVRVSLQALPPAKAFRVRASSAGCVTAYDPAKDDLRLRAAASSRGTGWIAATAPGRLDDPNLTSVLLGGGSGTFVPKACSRAVALQPMAD
jgi:hypothetical protein